MAFSTSGPEPAADSRYALLLVPLAGVMVALLLVFFVFFNYATVSGPSMLPTLLSEDRLLLTRTYTTPHRGDIVVFDHVQDDGSHEEVVKRVVGIPGDTVTMRGDTAIVDGKPEAFRHGFISAANDVPFGPTVVPRGTLFVLGDNRPVSLDSRFIGFVPMTTVKGRAVGIFAPVTRMRPVPGGN